MLKYQLKILWTHLPFNGLFHEITPKVFKEVEVSFPEV